jgi:hypothetical protein
VRARKGFNRFARALKPLPKGGRLQVEGFGSFRGRQIEDFTESLEAS